MSDASSPPLDTRLMHTRLGIWRTHDATDGLVAGARKLAQDHDGYLWMATAAGLAQFDGVEFRTLTTHDGLPDNNVSSVLIAPDKTMWVATLGAGVVRLQDRTVTRHYTQADGLTSDLVSCMALAQDGRLWVGTQDGLSCIDDDHVTAYTVSDGLIHPHVLCLHLDAHGTTWIGTFGGVSRIADGAVTNYTVEQGLGANAVWGITEDHRGRLWFATDGGGASILAGDTFTQFTVENGLPSNRLRCIHIDRGQNLWFATWGAGVARYDGTTVTPYAIMDGLLDNRASDIFEDLENQIWVGHALSGLSCFDPYRMTLLSDAPVFEVLIEDKKGRLWFGDDERLCCLHNGLLRSRSFPSRINALLEDSMGRFWVGTRVDGLFLFDSVDTVWANHKHQYGTADGLSSAMILSIYETPDATICVGMREPGSLARFTGSRFESLEVPNNVVFRIIEDSQHRLWFGGYDACGLGCLENGVIHTYTTADGMPSNSVQSLLEDAEHRIWIGTQEGLCTFDDRAFTSYGPAQGLNSVCHQVSATDSLGQRWFGTLRGGVYIANGRHFQWLTSDDGLPSNSITGLIPREDGSMVIGTYRGIALYRPGPKLPPRATIRSVGAEPFEQRGNSICFSLTQAHHLVVRFSALSLSTRHMRYSYQLEGYDNTWHDTWSTSVCFEGLPVGIYIFRVIAVSRALLESEEPAVLSITITPDPSEQLRFEYEAKLGEMARRLESQRRSNRQNRVLVDLTRSQVLEENDLSATLREVVEVTSHALECERGGAWLLSSNDSHFECVALYERAAHRHTQGDVLSRSEYPVYFDRLAEDRTLAANDALTDEAISKLLPAYVRQHGITTMIHAAVRVHGRMVGLISAEHVGKPHQWALDEQYFVGSIADFVSLAIEMFERRKAEEALRASEERYRTFITRTTEGIWRCELERPLPLNLDDEQQIHHLYSYGFLAECNDSLARMYGFEHAADMVGLRLRSDSSGWWLQDPQRLRALVQSGYHQTDVESYRVDSLGNSHCFLSNVVGITKEDMLVQIWGVQQNITEAKLAEEHRLVLEEQLRRSHKMEAIGRLAGGVAHDFNNLLTAILGCTDLLLSEPTVPDTAHEYLEEIRAASGRGASLTHQLLAFSRRQVLQPKIVSINDIVQEMDRMLRRLIGENIELTVTIDKGLGYIKADPSQVEQVILNLIVNARDAMPQGGRLQLETRRVDVHAGATPPSVELEPGRYAMLSVRDTGCGMSEAAKAHIFEPFFTTKGDDHGTGLGLSTVYGIVRQSGGAISFDSELDAGTTFNIYLPCTGETPLCLPDETDNAEGHTGSETILVVEDEEIVRSLVNRILRMSGYDVLEARDPDNAEELCRTHQGPIHLLLTDVMMPKVSGYQLAQRLQPIRPEMRVLFMSGYTDEALAVEHAEARTAPFIQKPFGIQALASKVRAVLEEPYEEYQPPMS